MFLANENLYFYCKGMVRIGAAVVKRIIYFCNADPTPQGGIKIIYRHAELLTSLGANAFVIHPQDLNFSIDWFRHNTQILRENRLNPKEDFIIIPEIWAGRIWAGMLSDLTAKGLAPRFGIFVQGGYLTHPPAPESVGVFNRAYSAADLVLTISEDTAKMVKINYPAIDVAKIIRVQWSIHDRFFAGGRQAQDRQKRTITYMPRKMKEHSLRVIHALRQSLPSWWSIHEIHNVSEETVATLLSGSDIFLSFSELEGLPLPPMEAALAGNLVIGYTGQGAREYWKDPNFVEVDQGNIGKFVTETLKAVHMIDAGEFNYDDLKHGIQQLNERYSLASEVERLKSVKDRIAQFYR